MTEEKTPKSLTRKQLYNLVWKKPATQIAKEYGLSDRGLGKLCERYGIPTPPRGYWAKVVSGQKIKKPPLLFSEKDGEGINVIESRVQASLLNRDVDNKEVLSDEIKEIQDFENSPKNKIKVSRSISDSEYHKVIQKDLLSRRHWDKSPTTQKDKRRYKILTTLLNALEARGYHIFYLDNLYRIKVQNSMEFVEIGIHDYIKRYKKDLSFDEIEKSGSKRKWIFVDEKTKFLTLNIYNQYGRSVKNIIETPENKLDDLLNIVVIEITKEILQQRNSRLIREDQQHRYYVAEELRRKEKERKENLLVEISNKNTADNIRKYVSESKKAHSSGIFHKENFEEWKQWALKYADEIDPWAH